PRAPRRQRAAHPASVSGRHRARDVRDGLLLGGRAQVLEHPRGLRDDGRLCGGLHTQPDVSRGLLGHDRAQRSGPRRVRTRGRGLRGAPGGVLGEPRPHAGHAARQRRRHAVSLRHLCRRRGASRARRTQSYRLRAAPARGRPWSDHHGDPRGARFLLCRGVPPAVPAQKSGRVLWTWRDGDFLPDLPVLRALTRGRASPRPAAVVDGSGSQGGVSTPDRMRRMDLPVPSRDRSERTLSSSLPRFVDFVSGHALSWSIVTVLVGMAPGLALWPLLHYDQIGFIVTGQLDRDLRVDMLLFMAVSLVAVLATYGLAYAWLRR